MSAPACLPSPPPVVAPQVLRTSLPPGRVIQLLGQQLAAAEFEITSSDSSGGMLQARRTREKGGNREYMSCRWHPGSVAATENRSTVAVSVTVESATDSTSVRMSLSVSQIGVADVIYDPSPCRSSGELEKQLAGALRKAMTISASPRILRDGVLVPSLAPLEAAAGPFSDPQHVEDDGFEWSASRRAIGSGRTELHETTQEALRILKAGK